jgi:hypothetical protein
MPTITDYIQGQLLLESPRLPPDPSTLYGVISDVPMPPRPTGFVELYRNWDTSNPTAGTIGIIDTHGEACGKDTNGRMALSVEAGDGVTSSAAIGLIEYDIPTQDTELRFRINAPLSNTLGTDTGFHVDYVDVAPNAVTLSGLPGSNRSPTNPSVCSIRFPTNVSGTLSVTDGVGTPLVTEHRKFTVFDGTQCITINRASSGAQSVYTIYEGTDPCYSFVSGVSYSMSGSVLFRYWNTSGPSPSTMRVDGINMSTSTNTYTGVNLLSVHIPGYHTDDRYTYKTPVDMTTGITWGSSGTSVRSVGAPSSIELMLNDIGTPYGINRSIDFSSSGSFHELEFIREVVSGVNNNALPGTGLYLYLSKGSAKDVKYDNNNLHKPLPGLPMLALSLPNNPNQGLTILNLINGTQISPVAQSNWGAYDGTNIIRIRFKNVGGYCGIEVFNNNVLVYNIETVLGVQYLNDGFFTFHSETMSNVTQHDMLSGIRYNGDVSGAIDLANSITGPNKLQDTDLSDGVTLNSLSNTWVEDTMNYSVDVTKNGFNGIVKFKYDIVLNGSTGVNKTFNIYLSSATTQRLASDMNGLVPDYGLELSKIQLPFDNNAGVFTNKDGLSIPLTSLQNVSDLTGTIEIILDDHKCDIVQNNVLVASTGVVGMDLRQEVRSITFTSDTGTGADIKISGIETTDTLGDRDQYLAIKASDKDGTELVASIDMIELQQRIDGAFNTYTSLVSVSNIVGRNGLTLLADTLVFVVDASGDPTVDAGSAMYFYTRNTDTYTKTFAEEDMDGLSMEWTAILNRPVTSVAQIDAYVTASHPHMNLDALDNVSEDAVSGNMLYNSIELQPGWRIDNLGW